MSSLKKIKKSLSVFVGTSCTSLFFWGGGGRKAAADFYLVRKIIDEAVTHCEEEKETDGRS